MNSPNKSKYKPKDRMDDGHKESQEKQVMGEDILRKAKEFIPVMQ